MKIGETIFLKSNFEIFYKNLSLSLNIGYVVLDKIASVGGIYVIILNNYGDRLPYPEHIFYTIKEIRFNKLKRILK